MTTIDTTDGFVRVTGTEARVCEMIASRQHLGIAKYGMTVAGNPLSLRQWLVHQQEELADALVYCTRSIEELDKKQDDFK
jgi:hypothetical protein